MEPINLSTLHKLSYGVFVLTARANGKDNGCIINVGVQVTDTPLQLIISVNKKNYTHELIMESGIFNLNILTEATPLKVIQHFGFQSGHEVDKFATCTEKKRAANGVLYIPQYTNGYLSGRIRHSVDLGTHTLFIAEITEAVVLSNEPSLTYEYYHKHIKPVPSAPAQGKTRWVCKVCGYVYEGEELPEEFTCPWCKHPASDFEKEVFTEKN